MIRVLVVEDSGVVRELLLHVLRADPEIQIIGTASDGVEALEFLTGEQPDVITMDIQMPRMDGLEATRRIMETHPIPIVMVSAAWDQGEVAMTFRAIEAGAVAFAEKPPGLGHPEHKIMATKLVQTVKAMAEVKVVRRWAKPLLVPAPVIRINPPPAPNAFKLVAIGASTGGPPVLQTILSGIPPDFPLPLLIVQHIAAGFVLGLANWLGKLTGRPLHLAEQGQQPLPGHAYLAPDGAHMEIDRSGRILLRAASAANGLCPSVSCLFRSVADTLGPCAIGVLLTGMGTDGAEELKRMRDHGAITVAQDKESSIVHGMPGEAIKLNAAKHILAPDKIAVLLTRLTSAQ